MLLDIYMFLWFLDNDIKLLLYFKSLIEVKLKVYVSIVFFWEIVIKFNINKLRFNYVFIDLENLFVDFNILVLNIIW